MSRNINLPETVNLLRGKGDLAVLRIAGARCDAEVYLHGAHVTRFHPRGQPRPILWLSGSSSFQAGKPIRGGVPICFPWFGPRSDDLTLPPHGFARLMEWELDDVHADDSGDIVVSMKLQSNDATRAYWPTEFVARHVITFASTLGMELTITNTGSTLARCEAALHSYLTVGDVRQVELLGLENTSYFDRLQPGERFQQDDRPIRFTGETDRTYLGTTATTTLVDPILNRRIVIEKSGSRSTVVWNPWIEKARAMTDFGDDEWPGMLCIETANVGEDAITLAPGESHSMRALISTAS